MVPILTVIAASIRKIVAVILEFFPTTDPYLDNVVLSLRMESSDPYYNQVVLGMHMDDTGLTDVKSHTITLNGNAARSATQSKFGGYSAYFDGTGDYLTLTTGSEFNFGTDDFTIECWLYPTTIGTTAKYFLGKVVSWSTNLDFSARIGITGVVTFYAGDNTPIVLVSDIALSINNWYHLAFIRNSGVTSMYINGIKQSSTHTGSVSIPNDATTLYIGSYTNAGSEMYYGYMDDLRITKGVARYTKNFSIPTAAFPEPANTAIDDTGKTVTTVGGAQFSGLSKYGSSSFYFDGTGDYLTLAVSLLSSGDFTVEGWVYPTSIPAAAYIYAQYNNTTDPTNRTLFGYTSTSIYFQCGSSSILLPANGAPSLNSWNHIAFCRLGTTVYGFLNGALMGTLTNFTGTLSSVIGSIGAGYVTAWDQGLIFGYLDDLRITKGVARYTSNFTPYKILTTAPAGDPLYNYTTLLLKMDGTNGGTTFTDNSYNPKTATLGGNTNTSTAQLKYGTASGYFDGVGDSISFATSTDWNLGAGNFTMEAWIYHETTSNTDPHIICLGDSLGTIEARIKLSPTRTLAGIIYHTSAYQVNISGTTVLAINTWYHVAFVRYGNVHSIYLNGVLEATATLSHTIPTGTILGYIGRVVGSALDVYRFKGYIDDVRLTKGFARYTATFQPPGPHIAAIDPDTDQWWLHTVLALRMDGTHGGTTFTDLKGKTVTTYGNASISSAVSKFGQAGYFDGTGDYLSIADSNDFFFDTNNFTIEFWYSFTVSPSGGNQYFYNQRVDGANVFELLATSTGFYSSIWLTGGQLLNLTATCTHDITSWNHFALVRDGSSWTIYKNGTSIGTATASITVPNFSASIDIGRWSGNGLYFNGYLDDYRITKGIARYTSTFTPSEKPLPTYLPGPDHDQYWDKVVLACPFDTTANDARNHTPTLVGNASISTAQKVFGAGSAYFDGTGDYISFPDSDDWHLGSSDFTMEAWVRPTGYAVSNDGYYKACIVGQDLNTSRAFSLIISGTASSFTSLEFTGFSDNTTGYTTVVSNYSFNLNTWYHVAAVRSGNLVYLFVDGICLNPGGTAFSRAIQNSTTTLKVGAQEYDATYHYYFTGYIDDLRITKGAARYTANFELPTVANILG